MSDLNLILWRECGEYKLWACRGAGKGCKRNRGRDKKKPCVDCYGPLDPEMTIGEVKEHLERGDA